MWSLKAASASTFSQKRTPRKKEESALYNPTTPFSSFSNQTQFSSTRSASIASESAPRLTVSCTNLVRTSRQLHFSSMFKKKDKESKRQLIDIVNNRNNLNRCGECAAEYPTWASWNLGVLLCGRCANVHKKILTVDGPLGRSISRVKSLTLEQWSDEQIDNLRRIGNRKARNKWNPKRVPFPSVDEDEEGPVEEYFREKYIEGRFRDDNIEGDDYDDPRSARYSDHSGLLTPAGRSRLSTVTSRMNLPRLTHRKLTSYEQTLYPTQLRQLTNMGFNDRDLALESLILAQGDRELALDILENDVKVNPGKVELAPDLPRRPRPAPASAGGSTNGSFTAPTSQPSSTGTPDWWNNTQALLAQQTTMQPQQGQPQIYQYTDPVTGQVSYVDELGNQYLDPNNPQHQQMLMQQTNPQLVAQQTAKQNIMSLYGQPTGQAQQQPQQQPQNTQQNTQQAQATGFPMGQQQGQFNQFGQTTGVPQQATQGMYGQPQQGYFQAQPNFQYGQPQYYG